LLFASGTTTQSSQPPMAHDELRYRCPNCCTRMASIRTIERGNARAQHVYKCPRCSVIMTERPEE
jgi:predicted SprT family Zn-dependent metalloprotease